MPLAVKIAPFFTSLAHTARQLVRAGADGLVLFNRFVHPDLDLGYGPATRIEDGAVSAAPGEIQAMDFTTLAARATHPLFGELFMLQLDEEGFREYHWAYLEALGKFLEEASARDLVVLRY